MYIFTFTIFIKPFEYENQNFKLIFFLCQGLGREGLTAFETLKSDIKNFGPMFSCITDTF